MKPPKESADIVLKTLQTLKKSSSPVAYLNRTFTQPVVTSRESRQLLNAINFSFRKALDGSRHPNDVLPPASIHNTYANKADDHVYKVVTGGQPLAHGSGKPDDLRSLMDPGTIGLFEQHIWQGTATVELAIECLKKYISFELEGPGENHRRDGGLIMLNLLKQHKLLDGIPKEPLRAWLIAALMLSSRPIYPFNWLTANIKQKRIPSAQQTFKEILQSYRRIYSTVSNADIELFLHILRYRDKSYRQKVSMHPRTKIANRLDPEKLIQVSDILEKPQIATSGMISSMAQSLYDKADSEGQRLIANALDLWNSSASFIGARIALKHFGNPYPGVDYLVSLGLGNIEVGQDGAVANSILGLQVVKELLRENQQEMAAEAMRIVSMKLLSINDTIGTEATQMETQLNLLKGLLQSENGKPRLANEYAWKTTLEEVKGVKRPGRTND